MIAFGVLGYLMRKFGYEPAPLVLAFVLGPMMENNLRKALIISDGSFCDLPRAADLADLPVAGRRCCWARPDAVPALRGEARRPYALETS